MNFIQSVSKNLPSVGEYDYVKGAVLVRVSRFLAPDQAKEYEKRPACRGAPWPFGRGLGELAAFSNRSET